VSYPATHFQTLKPDTKAQAWCSGNQSTRHTVNSSRLKIAENRVTLTVVYNGIVTS